VSISAIITIVASVAGVIAAVVAGWQLRVQVLDRRDARSAHAVQDLGGGKEALPVAPPFGRLPARVRGRDALLRELRRGLARQPRRRGGAWVLAGMGGVGKSTVALRIAEMARVQGWRVWWVNAADGVSLTGGMLEVLDQMGAPDSVTRPVREGAPVAADRAWEFLSHTRSARRCLLVFDNADDPELLAPCTGRPADGTGWIRPDSPVTVIVTTRHGDPATWGASMRLHVLRPLDEAAGADVLRDLAATADRTGSEAAALARRLGGLPLALHLAGTHLGSSFSPWHSFADYLRALDSVELPDAVIDIGDPRADPRATVIGTWEFSLQAL
jgi:NB-ARC domain